MCAEPNQQVDASAFCKVCRLCNSSFTSTNRLFEHLSSIHGVVRQSNVTHKEKAAMPERKKKKFPSVLKIVLCLKARVGGMWHSPPNLGVTKCFVFRVPNLNKEVFGMETKRAQIKSNLGSIYKQATHTASNICATLQELKASHEDVVTSAGLGGAVEVVLQCIRFVQSLKCLECGHRFCDLMGPIMASVAEDACRAAGGGDEECQAIVEATSMIIPAIIRRSTFRGSVIMSNDIELSKGCIMPNVGVLICSMEGNYHLSEKCCCCLSYGPEQILQCIKQANDACSSSTQLKRVKITFCSDLEAINKAMGLSAVGGSNCDSAFDVRNKRDSCAGVPHSPVALQKYWDQQKNLTFSQRHPAARTKSRMKAMAKKYAEDYAAACEKAKLKAGPKSSKVVRMKNGYTPYESCIDDPLFHGDPLDVLGSCELHIKLGLTKALFDLYEQRIKELSATAVRLGSNGGADFNLAHVDCTQILTKMDSCVVKLQSLRVVHKNVLASLTKLELDGHGTGGITVKKKRPRKSKQRNHSDSDSDGELEAAMQEIYATKQAECFAALNAIKEAEGQLAKLQAEHDASREKMEKLGGLIWEEFLAVERYLSFSRTAYHGGSFIGGDCNKLIDRVKDRATAHHQENAKRKHRGKVCRPLC